MNRRPLSCISPWAALVAVLWAPWASAQTEDFFLYGDRFLEVRKSATLNGAAGGGGTIGTGGDLVIGGFSSIEENYDTDEATQGQLDPGSTNRVVVHADGDLQADAQITGDAYFGGTVTLGTGAQISGTTYQSQSGLPTPPIPAWDAVGNEDLLIVESGQTAYAGAGLHGLILVQGGGRLILTGGNYHVGMFWVENGGIVEVQAGTHMTIETRFIFGWNTAVELAPSLSPRDFEIFVHSSVPATQCPSCDRYEMRIDTGSDFKGVIFSPSADIVLGDYVDFEGTILAGSLSIGKSSVVTYAAPYPGAGPDVDGDGYTPAQGDCDDNDPNRHPGATELCNGVDDDCDSVQDDGASATFYADTDSDTFGDPLNSQATCPQPTGYVTNALDCDDTSAAAYPGAVELLDGIDQNCDGQGEMGPPPALCPDTNADNIADIFLLGQRFIEVRKSAIVDGTSGAGGCIGTAGYLTIGPYSTVEDSSGSNDPQAGYLDPGGSSGLYGHGNATVGTGGLLETDSYFGGDVTLTAGEVQPADVFEAVDENRLPELVIPAWDVSGGSVLNEVPEGQIQVLGPGDIGIVVVKQNARLILLGGDYHAKGFFLEPNAVLQIDDTTRITNETNYVFGPGSAVDLMSGLTARDLELHVDSSIGPTCVVCDPGVDRTDTRLEYGAVFQGVIIAPDADVVLMEDVVFTGSIRAGSISIGQRAHLAYVAPYPPSTNDADGDGHAYSADCNDADASIHPGATEVCDGIDNDCDAQEDEGVTTTFYRDADEDGHGTSSDTIEACAVEDAPGYVAVSGDCNDASSAIHPGAAEVCNQVDDDCDTETDEGLSVSTVYLDSDGDGFGDPAQTSESCGVFAPYVAQSGDCNDASTAVHPGAAETCNGVDDNCTGGIDEGVKTTFYRDQDEDGYGTSSDTVEACNVSEAPGYVAQAGDCNDALPSVFPGATETCNQVDDDCDGSVDEGLAVDTFYLDADDDGSGDPSATQQSCGAFGDYVSNSGDCDDANAAIHPGADEVCNEIDDNCDGQIDETGSAVTYYRDADSDGHGTPTDTEDACDQAPPGYVASSDDCDDTNASVYSGAPEVCNQIDDDCDAEVDEGLQLETFYLDADGDGFGVDASTVQECSAPDGYAAVAGDCGPNSASVHPAAEEVCGDGIDQNCDGSDAPCAGAPVLSVSSPVDGTFYRSPTFLVAGEVQGGTAPVQLTVNGTALPLVGSTYSAPYTLPSGPNQEGPHNLMIEARDAQGRASQVSRDVVFDQTAPALTVTRPGGVQPGQTVAATESPYLVTANVGDFNLGTVTINGVPVDPLAGGIGLAVPLSQGVNPIEVRARDLSGNTTTFAFSLELTSAPPSVSIIEPADGYQAEQATVLVRAEVLPGGAAITAVAIGGASASQEGGSNVWAADVTMNAEENVVTASAIDTAGLQGTDDILIRYRDPLEIPLEVVAQSPARGAKEIEPDSVITLTFNKPIDRSTISGFTVSADGSNVAGGHYVAPGEYMASFSATAPLPVGKRLFVRAEGIASQDGGPPLVGYSAELFVRDALTVVRGVITDPDFKPIGGARISVRGTPHETVSTADGNFAFVGLGGGAQRLRIDGGSLPSGAPLPVVERNVYVDPHAVEDIGRIPLTPVVQDTSEYVSGAAATTVTFGAKYPGLSLSVPADGLAFADGLTGGYLTATLLDELSRPFPAEPYLFGAVLWQVSPWGTRTTAPMTPTYPNLSGMPPGQLVPILGFDESSLELGIIGTGHVSANGALIEADEPITPPSLDFIGYLPVSPEAAAALEVVLAETGGSTGAMLDSDRLNGVAGEAFEILTWLITIPEAHAQSAAQSASSKNPLNAQVAQLALPPTGTVVSGYVRTKFSEALPGVHVHLASQGEGQSSATTNDSGFYVSTPFYYAPGVHHEMAIARLPLSLHYTNRVIEPGQPIRVQTTPTSFYATSVPFEISPGQKITNATVIVNALIFDGTVTLRSEQGDPIPVVSGSTSFDSSTSALNTISLADAQRTWVHFFKASDLDTPIAKYQHVGEVVVGGEHHGTFSRLRVGVLARPSDVEGTSAGDEQAPDPLKIYAGETLVVFAVNHATGYSGIEYITVPESGDPHLPVFLNLYPPELEVLVSRSQQPTGFGPAIREEHLIRNGGMATTDDRYVRVSTRWRVRVHSEPELAVDGGIPLDDPFPWDVEADAGAACGGADGGCPPNQIRDDRPPGRYLRRVCDEISDAEAITPAERERCVDGERPDFVDVPSGVPPLKGQLVMSGAGGQHTLFDISPNRGETVALAVDLGETAPALDVGRYYVHVVGRAAEVEDQNGDGVLSPEELESPPPSFADGVTPGVPTGAIPLASVYRRRPQEQAARSGTQLPEYVDFGREAEFEVIDIVAASFSAQDESGTRPLDPDDNEAASAEGDLAYNYLWELIDAEGDGRHEEATGTYSVRFGGDLYGYDCDVGIDRDAEIISGDCDGEFIPSILAAHDIVYLELYLSGNSENVLYQMNFLGLSKRRDHQTADTTFTAPHSTAPRSEAYDDNDDRKFRASVSTPNKVIFFVSPKQMEDGFLDLCGDDLCADLLLRLRLEYDNVTEDYSFERAGGRIPETYPAERLNTGGLDDAVYFSQVVPADLAQMENGDYEAKTIFMKYVPDPPASPSSPSLSPSMHAVSKPRGAFDSRGALPAGHMSIAGVEVASGHLSRSYDDWVVPEKGITRRFSRTYLNANHDTSPLGTGWMHNYESYLLEESYGRYQVVIEGQSYDFPDCAPATGTLEEALASDPFQAGFSADPCPLSAASCTMLCRTDLAHGGRLALTLTKPSGSPANVDTVSAIYDDGAGTKYHYGRRSQVHSTFGGRRYLLTQIVDLLQNPIVLEYGTDDWVDSATRTGGLSLAFTYAPLVTSTVAPQLHGLVNSFGLGRLVSVSATLGSVTVATLFFDHDVNGHSRNCVSGTTAPASQSQSPLNLVRACRLTRVGGGAPIVDQQWTNGYRNQSGGADFEVRNELESESLEVFDAAAGSTPVAFSASYAASMNAESPGRQQHVDHREVITSATVQGQVIDFAYPAIRTRRIAEHLEGSGTRDTTLHLTPYGSVERMVGECGESTADWEAGPDDGKVVANETTDAQGIGSSCSHDERNRPTNCTTDAPGDPDEQPIGLDGATVSTGAFDANGVPSTTTVPGVGGAAGVVVTNQTTNGFLTGQSTVDGPSWSQPLDVNGLPHEAGEDALGNSVTFGYQGSPPEFMQPTSVTVACSGNCPTTLETFDDDVTPLQSVTYTLAYDHLGRLVSVTDSSTGVTRASALDAIGRPKTVDVSGVPNESWTTTYALSGASMTVSQAGTRNGTSGLTRSATLTRGLIRTATNEAAEATDTTYDSDECAVLTVTSGPEAGREENTFVRSGGVLQRVDVRVNGTLQRSTHYDVQGNPVRWEFKSSIGSPDEVEEARYDLYGVKQERIFGSEPNDSGGVQLLHHVRFRYDAFGRDIGTEVGENDVDAAYAGANIDTVSLDPATGRIAWSTEVRRGVVTFYKYDVLGRVVESERNVQSLTQNGTTPNYLLKREVIAYEGVALEGLRERVTYTTAETPFPDTDVESREAIERVRYRADGLIHEREFVEQLFGLPTSGSKIIPYSYDITPAGRITRTEIGTFGDVDLTVYNYLDEGGVDVALPDAATQTFSGAARLERVNAPGEITTYQYDGPWERTKTVESSVDGYRTIIERTFDTFGREKSVVESRFIHGLQESESVQEFDWNNPSNHLQASVSETRRTWDPAGEETPEVSGSQPFTQHIDGNGHIILTRGLIQDTNNGPTTVQAQWFFFPDGSPAGFRPGINTAIWGFRNDQSVYEVVPASNVALCRGADFGPVSFVPVAGDVEAFQSDAECFSAAWANDDGIGLIFHGTMAGVSGVFIVFDVVTGGAGSILTGGLRMGARAAIKASRRASRIIASRGAKAATSSGDNLARTAAGRLRRAGADDVAGVICQINCFPAGTLVVTEAGLRPIEEIEKGDRVWSRHDETGEEEWRPVVETFVRPPREVLELELVGQGGSTTLAVTGEHPFWMYDQGWTPAAELPMGAMVYTLSGGWLRVGASTWAPERQVVYNLEVEGNHNYFVGKSGVWVHNACKAPALFDNNVLIDAFRGDARSLDAIASRDVFITRGVLREFLFTRAGARVGTFAARRAFLRENGIKVIKAGASRAIGESDEFGRVALLLSRNSPSIVDVSNVAAASALKIPLFTGEARLMRTITSTFSKKQLPDLVMFRVISGL